MSKIIKAVFTGRFCKTQRVFQFDTDDKLQIVNVDLPANYTVDFSNSKTGDSVSVLATSDTVQIPPDLFVPGSEIYAWIWLSDSNGGHTRCEATIPIDPRARRTGTEPTPAQASAWDEAVDTLNETIEGIPAVINSALTEAKESGEFDGEDGADGSGVWYTTERISGDENPFVRRRDLIGREGAAVQVHDLLIAPDVGYEGEPTTLYEITSVGTACALNRLCKMQGEDGTSPGVTITEIEGGHRITITDEAHPDGQSFDVMDGSGGSETVDDDFSETSENPVQNKVITAALNAALRQLQTLGLSLDDKVDKVTGKVLSSNDFTDSDKAKLDGAASEQWVTDQGYATSVELGYYRTAADQDTIDQQQNAAIAGKYTKPGTGIPKTDLAAAVQTSLGKADTALQSAPVTSVNGQTGAVSLSIPSTASDVGAVAANQGAANANKVLTVNSSGVVVPEDNRFVVTCTPTAADYSGVMDKAISEIYAAHQAGKKIIFRLMLSATTAYETECTARYDTGRTYPSFNAFAVVTGPPTGDAITYIFTGARDSDSYDYAISIFPLASGQWTGGSY